MTIDKNKYLALIILSLLIATFFCGCTSNSEELELDVFFKSSVTNLVNYTIDFNRDKDDKIVKATVSGIIENKIDRVININITVEFYDEEDNYINEVVYRIDGLRTPYNNGYQTTFSTSYSGENVDKISYVKIYADEILI